jgi:uncharacterized OB-fold protein
MARMQLPNRSMDPYATQFWEQTLTRELRLQRCDECGAFRWPPCAICDVCLSESYDWIPVSGDGTLCSWVTFQRQYFPEYPPPHRAIVVALAEGPLFVSALAGGVERELEVDLPLRLEWIEASDKFGDFNLPVFRPT